MRRVELACRAARWTVLALMAFVRKVFGTFRTSLKKNADHVALSALGLSCNAWFVVAFLASLHGQ